MRLCLPPGIYFGLHKGSLRFYGTNMPMRWIYLSPHLDDAALSAGGLIHEQVRSGLPVEIWTLFCGYPQGGLSTFAQVLHKLWGFSSAEECIRRRREEDKKAAELLGANARHFDFLDAIYRRGPQGEWLYPLEVAVEPLPVEAGLPAQIAEALAARLLPDDILVCQLGIGGHVDHLLARQAAERLGLPLWYDADLPYLFDHPEELAPLTAGLDPALQPVSEAALGPWERAIRAYDSQLSTVFHDAARIGELLREYRGNNRGICLWRSAGAGLVRTIET